MNKIKERRNNGAICPKCKNPDYELLPKDYYIKKPTFMCKSCLHRWQYGKDGGIYFKLQ